MPFSSWKRNSHLSTTPGGGRSDQQSSGAPSQPARLFSGLFGRASKSTSQLRPENHSQSNNLPLTLAAAVVGSSPVVVHRTQDTDHPTSIHIRDSTLPPTGKQEENGNKGTLRNKVTNSPTESTQKDPPAEPASIIQSPGIQLPAVNVQTPTSQSHSVVCHPSIQDGKSVTSNPPPPQPPSTWERTLDIAATMLHDHDLPALDRDTLSSTENIQAVLEALNTAQGEDQKVKLIGKDRLRRILRGVEKYTKIVDSAVQHSPEVTALVWAGIRGILQVSILLPQVEIYMNSGFTITTGRFP